MFEIDGASGELHATYRLIEGRWLDSADEAFRRQLAATDAAIFPFDWRTTVPLSSDQFH